MTMRDVRNICVPRNLGICAISESRNCMPISRLGSQYIRTISELRSIRLRNLEIACASAICERNGLTGWERLNWLTERELRTFRNGDSLNGGTPQVWDLSAPIPRPRGREFLRVGELPRSPWCGGLSIHARHWRWRRSCKSLLCTSLTFIYNVNSKGSIVHATEIA